MEVSCVPWWCQPLATPGPTLTVPEASPSELIAWARVMPGVGLGSGPRASLRMSRSSDVTLVPSLQIVRAPALVLDVELRAALRDPVVDRSEPRGVGGLARDRMVMVGALEPDLALRTREGEHRHAALFAVEGAVRLQLAQSVSDLHRCGPSWLPATLCRTALASGRGAFSHRTRAARPH